MVSPAWQKTALGQFTAAQIPGGGQGSIPGEELVPAAPAREPAVDKASSTVAASADGRVVTCAPRLPRAVSGQLSAATAHDWLGSWALRGGRDDSEGASAWQWWTNKHHVVK